MDVDTFGYSLFDANAEFWEQIDLRTNIAFVDLLCTEIEIEQGCFTEFHRCAKSITEGPKIGVFLRWIHTGEQYVVKGCCSGAQRGVEIKNLISRNFEAMITGTDKAQ